MKKELEDLKKIIPKANFKVQPEDALKEIIHLENKYKMNTYDMLVNDAKSLDIEVVDKWIMLLETYITFDGDISKINQVNKDFYVVSNCLDTLLEEYVCPECSNTSEMCDC